MPISPPMISYLPVCFGVACVRPSPRALNSLAPTCRGPTKFCVPARREVQSSNGGTAAQADHTCAGAEFAPSLIAARCAVRPRR